MYSSLRNLRNTRRSRRPQTRRRKQTSRQKLLENFRGRLADAGLVLTAAGLVVTHLYLVQIGPPPAIRIDDLWVLANESTVEAALRGVFLAVMGSVLPILLGRRRLAVVVLWVLAAVAAAKFFSDRLPVIASVLLDHAG